MPAQLIVIRHGNTFEPEEQPRRIGGLTDIPLVASGIQQAQALGLHFKTLGLQPAIIYSGPLKRTQQTAQLIQQHGTCAAPIVIEPMFKEIDHGPDENQTQAHILKRIGQQALDAWEKHHIPPSGWLVNPTQLQQAWLAFGERIAANNQIVFVVTSAGIARFLGILTGDLAVFNQTHGGKLYTGAYGHLIYNPISSSWEVVCWNKRP